MGPLTGERRALSATILAFYGFLYFILAINPDLTDFAAMFGAMAFIYGLAFFSLVAGYFWARWYSIGLSISALLLSVFAVFQTGGLSGEILFYGGTHAAVCVLLLGKAMSACFDGRADWRSRFHLDEAGSQRLGRAVIRATISLPYIVSYALAPKLGMGLVGFTALALAGGGLYGLVKLRTWGVVAMAGAAAALLGAALLEPMTGAQQVLPGELTAAIGITAAAAAAIPFAGPVLAFLRSGVK